MRLSAERTKGVTRSLPPQSCRRTSRSICLRPGLTRKLTDIRRFVFAVVFLLNLFLIAAGSSGAVPFGAHYFCCALSTVLNAVAALSLSLPPHRYHSAGHHSLVWHFRTAIRYRLVLWVKTWCKRYFQR